MSNLYTIGYTEKSAQQFFNLLKVSTANKLIDIRLHNTSQLAGFTKKADLIFFLKTILNWEYLEAAILAPTKDILADYKHKKITWNEYEIQYLNLLHKRRADKYIKKDMLKNSVLLCSEHLPDFCHRRLAAEYLNTEFGNIFKITHLY